VTVNREENDLRNINSPKVEGHHDVEGPRIENPNITASLKTKQVNIRMEEKLKFEKLGIIGMMALWISLLSYSTNIRIYSLLIFQT